MNGIGALRVWRFEFSDRYPGRTKVKRQITVPRKKGWNGNLENFEDLTRAFGRRSVWRRASVFENDGIVKRRATNHASKN